MSGLDLQRELNRREERLPIIFITGHADARTARDALKNRAFHFCYKTISDMHLLDLIGPAARREPRSCCIPGSPRTLTDFASTWPWPRKGTLFVHLGRSHI